MRLDELESRVRLSNANHRTLMTYDKLIVSSVH